MTICHHVLAKFLTDPLLSCLMKKKDEVTVRKRIFPNRLGEGILISSWGYKALCFIQKPLTPVDFFISILKIGQCPWSRISSNKLLPCSQQWKQIISLFFFFFHYRVVIQQQGGIICSLEFKIILKSDRKSPFIWKKRQKP